MSDTENAAVGGAEGQKPGVFSRFGKLDIKKKIQYLAIMLIIIVILTIYFASGSIGAKKQEDTAPSATQGSQSAVTTDSIEAKLASTLSRIEGAGDVEVMITYESTSEIVPAISVDKQTSTTTDNSDNGTSTTSTENTQSEVVTVGGSSGNSALVLKEVSPKIRGVIVVAEGADDITVKLNLLSAVETLLSVSPRQVDVYKMKH
jgi:stage III sporulation protein AG